MTRTDDPLQIAAPLRRRSLARRPNEPEHSHDERTAEMTCPGLFEGSAADSGRLVSNSRGMEVEKDSTCPWKVSGRVAACVGITLMLVLAFATNVFDSTSGTPATRAAAYHRQTSSLNQALNHIEHSARPATTIHLEWTISAGLRSPDGVQRRVYLIDGVFPGPTLEARSGDVLDILVTNTLKDEGLSIHFHGLHMRGYNSMDGAVGFTQDPIFPGETFRYHFQISEDQVGTFWYHAHDEVQRADGIFGALIVHRPKGIGNDSEWETEYDEERVLLINDWYHRPAKEALGWYMRAGSFGMEPVPDSILINGIGFYNCSNMAPSRPFPCDVTSVSPGMSFDGSLVYRLRVINSGMLAGISITFTGHSMTVIKVDGGGSVVPHTAGSVGILYPGQRMDVILRWDSSAPSSTIQISLDTEAFRYVNSALATSQGFPLLLERPARHSTRHSTIQKQHYVDLATATSRPLPQALPKMADQTMVLYTKTLKLAHLSNIPHGFINQTSWKPQSPPLTQLGRNSYNANQFVPLVHSSTPRNSSPRWLDVVLNNLDEDDHPFHLHGHDAYILQTHTSKQGFSAGWNPFDTQPPPGGAMNRVDPMRRDTFVVPRRGYVVFRMRTDNPWLWMLHCHVLWHQASGMAMGIEVAPGMDD